MSAAIFFDLDGTLCMSRVPFAPVFAAACGALLVANPQLAITALQQAWNAAIERPGPSTVRTCLAHALDACQAEATDGLIDHCASHLRVLWAEAQSPAPDAFAVLAALRAQGQFLGVITNGPYDAQMEVFAVLGLEAWCGGCFCSGDRLIGVRKPAPAIFAYALEQAGVRADDAWYVGDNARTDIAGAATVGMRTCWLAAPEATLPAGIPAPTARIARLADLPAVLAAHVD